MWRRYRMSRKSNRYTEEFRTDVIRMIKEGGRSINDVARDLGVNDQTIRNWLKDEKDHQDPIKSRISELEIQIKAKDKKIADQEMTIDILKKATAIFAQNSRK
jgi:transposase-like protein